MTISSVTLQKAVNIEEQSGVSILAHNSIDGYINACLQTISFESLDEIASDQTVPVGDKMREKIKQELQRRYDKGMGNIQ